MKPEHMCVYVLCHVTAAAIHTYASPAKNIKKQKNPSPVTTTEKPQTKQYVK